MKNDLVLHFCAFGALTIPVRLLWRGWPSIMALALLAALIEVIQIFQPARNATFEDLAASFAGVLAAAALVALLRRGLRRISNSNHK